jgi:hypothetical protein
MWRHSSSSPTPFQREVGSRFGLVPNFFDSAPDAPDVERLWAVAVSAYFDNPIPSLFKEQLAFAKCVIASSATRSGNFSWPRLVISSN